MKPCNKQWRETLLDHVLGGPASDALAEHLQRCGVCSEALREWRVRMAHIEAGIRRLADSEPSSQAGSRVMAELRVRQQRLWLPEWAKATATLAGLALLLTAPTYIRRATERRRETQKMLAAASAIGSWKSPTESLLRFPADPWLKSPPQLGRYFYEIGANAPEEEKNP